MRAGYIVLCAGLDMRLETDQPKLPPGGVLVFGGYGTIFRTRARARRAIARTVRYAAERALPWPIRQPTQVKIVLVRFER